MVQPADGDSLTIVIPALNEEAAIGDTVGRCLSASSQIMAEARLSAVELIVVSDGSTDRTAEIARGFDGVKVIEFVRNRGYGAAIKEGWRQGGGTLLGFLDADGTCDPRYFVEFCRVAKDHSADVVLGSRLGANSKMPAIRRLGNRIYAFLLGLLCGRHVTDTASGMRVVRRGSLKHLYPLPDGLHFTPSMSARALLNDLRVVEVPMRYEERIGESKLHVLRDGVRFLRTIFEGVLCYRPERILGALFLACGVLVVLLAAYPAEFYFRNGRLEEWMIYRFVACYLVAFFGLMLVMATALVNLVAGLGPRRAEATRFVPAILTAILTERNLVLMIFLLVGLSILFLWPGIVEFVTTAHTTLHWSRLLAGSFTLLAAGQTAIFALLTAVISLWMRYRTESQQALQVE
jgi:glycosyltransferase involved in cell wall biosynthesis